MTTEVKNCSQINKIANGERLFSRLEASEFLGVSKGTLEVWACTKRYPLKFIKVGRLVKYRERDLLDFLDLMTQSGSNI